MTGSEIIKMMMTERGMTRADLAKHLGITDQGASNRLYRDTWAFSDVVSIAAALGFTVRVVDTQATDVQAADSPIQAASRDDVIRWAMDIITDFIADHTD